MQDDDGNNDDTDNYQNYNTNNITLWKTKVNVLLVENKNLKERNMTLQADYQKLQVEYACIKGLLARADNELIRLWENHNNLTGKAKIYFPLSI